MTTSLCCRVPGCTRQAKTRNRRLCTAHEKQEAKGRPLERVCLDCGANISGLHGACKRCPSCQPRHALEVRAVAKARRGDAHRRRPRVCRHCNADISGQSASFRYCEACRTTGPRAARIAHEKRWRCARYGLTVEDLDAMLAAQPTCPGCDTDLASLDPPSDLVIDHCHATQKVRGLLCRRCNLSLGLANDSADVLEALAAYRRTA